MKKVDEAVKEKIREALISPETVRQKVAAIRKAYKPLTSQQEIEETIAEIKRKLQNLYKLAENATDDENILSIAERMNKLEVQKRETEKLLYVLEDAAVERAEIEKELVKFETWAERVQPFLTDTEYLKTATYAELRLAVRILGIKVTVFPSQGDYPFRFQLVATVPEIFAKVNIDCQSSQG
jgi:hypothetical protein